MPATDSRQSLSQFLTSVSDISGKTEEELLRILLEAKQYKELQDILQTQTDEIVTALKTQDSPKLQRALDETFLSIKKKIASLPEQVAAPIEKTLPENYIGDSSLIEKSKQIQETLRETPQILEAINKSRGETKRAYIEKLVKNYSKWMPQEPEVIQKTTDTIVAASQNNPDVSFKNIIDRSIPTSFPKRDDVVAKLQNDTFIKREIQTIQKETPKEISSSFIEALVDASNPTFFKEAFIKASEQIPSIQQAVEQAKKLSIANEMLSSVPKQEIQYDGFFTKMSSSGTLSEKLLAPVADTIFSFFPKDAQEKIVTKVLGASWTKEVSNNSFLQKILGPTLQSSPIQDAIRKGNQLFVPSGQKNVVFSRTQTIFVDLFTTIFHPEVSEIYLQLAGLKNTQMGQSVGQFYLGQLANQGVTYAAKKGASSAGKVVAEKTAGSALGKFLGGIFGSEAGPVGSFVGAVVLDKIISGLWSGAKKTFNFITMGWLGNLVSGNYNSTPLYKDPVFIISASLICVVALLFVIPFSPITLIGNSLFQQTVQDNAYIGGMGGVIVPSGTPGSNAGAGFSCAWTGPTPPQTSISFCPVHAPITQRPFDPAGSHKNADAYDFGCSDGTPIYAAHDGYVVSVVTSYQPNQYQYASFGNNVVLVGTNTAGQLFCTNYGHLLDVSPGAMSAYQNKTLIHAGDVIGYSDTTGYTYGSAGLGHGPHLHFGYKGSGTLSLPANCP